MNDVVKRLTEKRDEHLKLAKQFDGAIEALRGLNGHAANLVGPEVSSRRKRKYHSSVSPSVMILEELTDGKWRRARHFHNRGVKPSVVGSTLSYLVTQKKVQRRGARNHYEYALPNGKG